MPSRPATAAAMLILLAACAGPGPLPTPGATTPPPGPWIAPDNAWSSSAPPPGLVGEGFAVGQVVPDVRLRDQHGDVVSLWQFHGDVVLLTISAVWCLPCRDLARDAEAVVADYDDVVLVTVLEEDAGGLRPEVSDAAGWAEAYGEGSPVLVDPERLLAPAVSGEFPVVLGLGRDLVVSRALGGGTAADLRVLIEAEL